MGESWDVKWQAKKRLAFSSLVQDTQAYHRRPQRSPRPTVSWVCPGLQIASQDSLMKQSVTY